jgi:uncharacterized protein YbjT (DUF2867 family)
MTATRVAVTGANGFVGRHVARRLLSGGIEVVNLTGHPRRTSPESAAMRTEPLDFADAAALRRGLAGASVLVNTYWVRFERGGTTYERAVANTERLLIAARAAGVQRVVQVSITNPSAASPLPYYRGKARVEELVRRSGLDWAIARPSWIYGPGDILLNNIAWSLRHVPVFGIPGDGSYFVQPVHVEDVAELIASLALSDEQRVVRDAPGLERFTFDELVRTVRWAIGARARIVHLPPPLALAGAGIVGLATRDVMLTADEVRGLLAGLLVSDAPPVGRTSLTQWAVHHRDELGRRYASELLRHYRAA